MNPTLPVIVVGVALTLLSAVQAWLLWRLSRMVAASARLEEKVGHLGDALSILTETSEAGFKAIADELTRRSLPAASASRPKTPITRLKAAARRGTSIADIAAAEHMSEGEVRLRLHLAERAPASRARTKAAEGRADALRA
jgi:DNA-directed RNA polymerase specialized sigma24 family protein